MCSLLGGRAAEELVFNEISTGAQNDLERATKQAYAMVSIFGMSEKVGMRSYYDSSGQSDFALTKPYSESMAQEIDSEVKRIIDTAYAMAEKVIHEHRDGLVQLAELLLEREVVFTEDVERIFGKRKKDIERERIEKEKLAELREGRKELEEQENEDAKSNRGPGGTVSAEGAAGDKEN